MIKKLFYTTLILVFFEGIIRKWFFPSSVVYMFKYIPVFIIIFILIYQGKSIKFLKKDYPYFKILFLFVTFTLVDILASIFGPLVWFVGIISYLGFLVFIFITPLVFKNFDEVNRFIDLIIVLSIPIFILGFMQFFLPQTHFLNHYSIEMDTIATAGLYTRITSIFNYITGYTTYLTFVLPLILSRMVYAKGKWKLVLAAIFVLGLFNLFATGSRGPVAITFVSIALILIWILLKAKSGTKTRFIITGILAAAVVTGLIFFNIVQFTSFDALMTRTSQIQEGEIAGRLIDLFMTPFKYAEIAGLGGFGIGSAHQITNGFGYNLNSLYHVPYEEPLERFVLEMGILGTILFLLLMFSILFDITKKVFYIKNKQCQLLAFAIYTTLLQYFVFLNNIPYNWMGALHFFLSIGLIIAIVNFDKQERLAERGIND